MTGTQYFEDVSRLLVRTGGAIVKDNGCCGDFELAVLGFRNPNGGVAQLVRAADS